MTTLIRSWMKLETQLVPTPNIDLSVSADDPDVTEEVAKAMNK